VKVLFIYPNLYAQVGFNYGLAFLSGALKEAGHETALVNANENLAPAPSAADIVRRVEEERPGLVGFSVVTTQFAYAVEWARAIKEALPDLPIVIGGVHATMDPAGCLETGAFDYVCVGEGEEAVVELAGALEEGRPATSIRNVWARDGADIVKNPVRPFTPLENLPEKDYSVFDFQRMIDAKDGWVGLMASRGCPFRCSYCFNHRMVELYSRDTGLCAGELGYVRHHGVDELLGEIEMLLSNYENIRTFIFDDDLFTFDKGYVGEFCRRYREMTDVPFVCNAHVRFFDEEIARTLKEGGCRIVKFGLESGSERVRRDVMHRYMTTAEIRKAFAAAAAAGLHSSAFVMMGLPGETRAEMDETVELLAGIEPGRFRWAIFFPFVNTDAYDFAAEAGLIDFEKMRSMPNFTDESCLDFGPEHNLRIRKHRAAYPWYVNARSRSETVRRLYSRLVQVLDNLPEDAFEQFESEIRPLDDLLHQVLVKAGHHHYSIRYNSFTGVSSAWND